MRAKMIRRAVPAGLLGLMVLAGGQALAGADGKALYASKCAVCHGADGVAKEMWAKKGMKNLNDAAVMKAKTDAEIAKSITDGVPEKKMPGFKDKWTAEEIQAVVQYVRALSTPS